MLNFTIIKLQKILMFFILIIIITLVILKMVNSVSNINPHYSKEDGKWAYVTFNEAVGRKIIDLGVNVDNDAFTVLKNKNYAKDKYSVFYKGVVVKEADPNTFEIVNDEGYSKDAIHVFIDRCVIIGANPNTFVCLKFPYSKDDKKIYCGSIPMFVDNIEEFKVTQFGHERITQLTKSFLETNSDYKFIDENKFSSVFYSLDSTGETNNQKFKGYKLVE